MASLPFTALFTGESFEPHATVTMLVYGGFAMAVGHFTWLANPLYVAAFFLSNYARTGGTLAVVAFLTALSVLILGEFPTSGAPSYERIVAIGWGYAFWLVSLGTLAFGILLKLHPTGKANFAPLVTAFWLAPLLVFAPYFVLGANHRASIETERDREFEVRCAKAGQHVQRRVEKTNSVYLNPDGNVEYRTSQDQPGLWLCCSSGIVGEPWVNAGYLDFFEKRDESGTGYTRHILSDIRGINVEKLASEYSVTTETHSIPVRLKLTGQTVTIRDLKDNSIMATSTVFFNAANGKLCGASGTSYSTSDFAKSVLGIYKGTLPTAK